MFFNEAVVDLAHSTLNDTVKGGTVRGRVTS